MQQALLILSSLDIIVVTKMQRNDPLQLTDGSAAKQRPTHIHHSCQQQQLIMNKPAVGFNEPFFQ
jgi:hypothetical protein